MTLGTLPDAASRLLYAAIMLTAIATAFLLGRKRMHKLAISREERAWIGGGAFIGAMLGAKLPYLLADLEGLASGRAWLDNGKTIVFGLVGGYLGVELVKLALNVRTKTGDAFVVPAAIAIAIGRIGCFSAGCCAGLPWDSPLACDFGDGIPRHPTQLYETAFHLLAAGVFLFLERRRIAEQQRIKIYILAYLVYRFASETLRPEPRIQLGLTIYQWLCLAFIPLFVLLWARDARSMRAQADAHAVSSEPA